MKTNTLRAKLLNCFFAFTLVFGLCIPSIGTYAYANPTDEITNDTVAAHVEGSDTQGENQSNDVGGDNGTGADIGNGAGDTNNLGDGVQDNANANDTDGNNNDNNSTETDVATTQADEIMPMADVTQGAFTVSGGVQGTDYSYASGVLTIKSSTPLTIKNTDPNTQTTDRIEIAAGTHADITLDGVFIVLTTDYAPLGLAGTSGTRAHVTLKDGSVNKLVTTGTAAAVQCLGTNEIVFDDEVRNSTSLTGNVNDRSTEVVPVDGRIGADVTLGNGTTLLAGSSLDGLSSDNPGTLYARGGKKLCRHWWN